MARRAYDVGGDRQDGAMRILVAPDKFAGTLTAVEAADAIAVGWRRRAFDDELDLAPMSDGGPGFVDVLHTALGGELLAVTVTGPFAEPVPAGVLVVGDGVRRERRPVAFTLTGGKGGSAPARSASSLVVAALDAGARTVVVGLGGGGTSDGGAGLLQALGATSDAPLDAGAVSLAEVGSVDLTAARARVGDVRLVAASDVDSPLTGLFGPRGVRAPEGIPEDRLAQVDGWLERFAVAVDRRLLGKGAEAAGRPGLRAARARSHPRDRDRPGRGHRAARGALPGRGPGRHGEVPSTSAVPARCRTASPRSPRRRCDRAWLSPGRSWWGRGRCARARRGVGVLLVDLVGERAFSDGGRPGRRGGARGRTWSR